MTSETIVDLSSGHRLNVRCQDGEWSVVLEDPEGSRKDGTWIALAGGTVKSSVMGEAAEVLIQALKALAVEGDRKRTPSPQPSPPVGARESDGARGAARPTSCVE